MDKIIENNSAGIKEGMKSLPTEPAVFSPIMSTPSSTPKAFYVEQTR